MLHLSWKTYLTTIVSQYTMQAHEHDAHDVSLLLESASFRSLI